MKKVALNKVANKFFAGSLVAAALFLSVHAHAANNITKAENDNNKVQIKYTGSNDEYLNFTVSYSNPTGNKFDLTFYDESGDVIYSNTFKDQNFVKRFSVPKSAYQKLTVVVSNANGVDQKKFDIAIRTKQVDDVKISQL
ncbi:MAG: hypothetical protein GTN67_11970 [Hydrotalea flava]|uniref:hypothetical protein n=1 Tax=Hydrotalea TaxID=1004300 RepID=UPI000835211A|nr:MULTISPECIES: hypothetical protein [Hydrotalea]NIM36052.1 hypothetical protein [Hydrotalea flava]NIM38899.1 hypothetical protein [Hydrotalea flava]NIN04089.1 hypothetical protein [Hydrotalea flava]NIN15532.1 hypothetical protein [Hydrotalea flava]NIO94825.1 hypothetical protein [Hydrotalea flava]